MSRKITVLCTREFQNSIKDSVHRLLSNQIELLGLGGFFEIMKTEIKGRNGSQFLFAGLANNTVDGIKSFEGVDYCWVEEAQTVSERSWSILIPTIRNDNSEIWLTFNPDSADDPTYKRFILETPPDTTVARINFCDNPWFPEVLRKEKDYLFSIDPEAAAHIWLGECRKVSNAQVLRGRYSVEPFEPRMDLWDGPYQGADWGFANDPTVLVRCWVFERTLYIEKEVYEIGVDIDMIPALFDQVPEVRKFMIRADSARPETVSYMQRSGFRIQSVNKWSGSVDDGVEHLRSYERVVIHPDCKHALEEARLYSFKVDRLSGDVLPQVMDRHNHCLSPGTMIETHRGRIPIEDVTPYDYALTRKGYKQVLWSGVSDRNREVYRVTTQSGKVLHGTGNHKILTQRGWLPIDAMRYGDYVLSEVTSCENRPNTTDSSIPDTQSLSVGQTAFISDPKRQSGQAESMTFTAKYGLMPTAQYPMVAISTTAMATPSIMPWITLNSLTPGTTCPSTIWANALRPNDLTWTESDLLQSLGTNPKLAEHGTERMGLKLRLLRRVKNLFASVAGSPTKASAPLNSAQAPASPKPEGTEGMTWLAEFALSAGKPITRHDSTPLVVVHDLVVSVSVIGTEDKVYDLTIEDEHEFFANGILVHNCMDALRYALEPVIRGAIKKQASRRTGGFKVSRTPNPQAWMS